MTFSSPNNYLLFRIYLFPISFLQFSTLHYQLIMRKEITRNITPNFIRFRKSPIPKQLEKQRSQRNSSKNSRGSFQQYENLIINSSRTKLPVECVIKSQKILNLVRTNRLVKQDQNSQKSRSGSYNSERVKPDLRTTHNFHQRQLTTKRKLSSSNKSLHKYKSPKVIYQQNEPQKQQIRAINEKDNLLKNLVKGYRPQPFMNKFKIRREQPKKKTIQSKGARKFFNDPTIRLNGIANLNKYEIYGQLGKGAYGTVRMAYDKTNDIKVALKIYEKINLDEPNKIRNVERQISIQAKISHVMIAKIIQAIEGPEEIIIVQEYGGANSLYRYLLSKPEHRLQQKEAKNFFKQIVQSVQYLHSEGIVHRDIKAENILINRQHRLKLIDFGFSLISNPPKTIDTFCGTPTYMAPQIVSKRDHVARYTDVWSLGILLYVLLQGNYPFRAKSQQELFQTIRRGQLSFIHQTISQESKQMIRKFLVIDPLKRPVLSDLITSVEWEEWFSF